MRLVADLVDHLGDRGIDLARHDAGAGLHLGQPDFREAGARARGEEPDIVGELVEVEHPGAEGAAEGGDVAHRLHQLDAVLGHLELEAGDFTEVLHHQFGVGRLGVDAGPDGRAADVHGAEPARRLDELGPVAGDGVPVGREFLSEADRRRVLQVGPARLDDAVELLAPGQEGLGQAVHRLEQGEQGGERREPHGGRDDVVGALRHVDVIVRVYRGVRAPLTAENLVGPIGEDFVAVHVVAGAGAGLVDVDHELVPKITAEDFVGGRDDRVGQLAVEPARLLVRECGGLLDLDDGVDKGRERPEPGDGVVFDGAQGLNAVESVCGNGLFAEGVLLDACLHDGYRLSGNGFTMQPTGVR